MSNLKTQNQILKLKSNTNIRLREYQLVNAYIAGRLRTTTMFQYSYPCCRDAACRVSTEINVAIDSAIASSFAIIITKIIY